MVRTFNSPRTFDLKWVIACVPVLKGTWARHKNFEHALDSWFPNFLVKASRMEQDERLCIYVAPVRLELR